MSISLSRHAGGKNALCENDICENDMQNVNERKKQMIDNNNTICEKGTYQFETN